MVEETIIQSKGLFLVSMSLLVVITCNGTGARILYNDVKVDYEALLQAYQTNDTIQQELVIPRDPADGPITVYVGMSLNSVMDFDGVNGQIKLVGSVSMEWQDDVGKLTGAFFKKATPTIFVAYDQIWTPNLVLINAAESVERIGDSSYKVRYNISSGYCHWEPRLIINAACTPDMTYYPFDEQTCVLTVLSWDRNKDFLKLEALTDAWNTDDLDSSPVWSVASTSSNAYLSDEHYSIDYTIKIKRKPLFLVLVIVIPVLLLSILKGFLFLIPPRSGERVGFGITCFLAFVVMLQTIMDLMPEASSPMSLLCFYVIVMLSFSVALNITNVFLMRMHLNSDKSEIPKLLIHFIDVITCKTFRRLFNVLRNVNWPCRRWTCVCKDIACLSRPKCKHAQFDQSLNTLMLSIRSDSDDSMSADGRESNSRKSSSSDDFRCESIASCSHVAIPLKRVKGRVFEIDNRRSNLDNIKSVASAKTFEILKGRVRKLEDKNEKCETKVTWEDIGRILDIFFVIAFCIVQILFTVFYLVPMFIRN